jgi:hypothetical protein
MFRIFICCLIINFQPLLIDYIFKFNKGFANFEKAPLLRVYILPALDPRTIGESFYITIHTTLPNNNLLVNYILILRDD